MSVPAAASPSRGTSTGTAPGVSTVRPYLVTGGRTSTGEDEVPLETLVRAGAGLGLRRGAGLPKGATREVRSIVELATERYLTVAELSALVALPVPVVRVVVDDLARQGVVTLHRPERTVAPDGRRVLPRRVLQEVLDGIAHL